MTDKELKKLSRSELLELLIDQMKENEKLRLKLKKAYRQLRDRKIVMEQAGSIAEAALQLNGVFEAAQAAAEQYLESLQYLSREQEASWAESFGEPAEESIGEAVAENIVETGTAAGTSDNLEQLTGRGADDE